MLGASYRRISVLGCGVFCDVCIPICALQCTLCFCVVLNVPPFLLLYVRVLYVFSSL